MPGGDKTGPAGQGPMTGRSAGYCAGFGMPGYANYGYGYGRGFGMGFVRGGGRGWRNRFCATGLPGWFRGRSFGPVRAADYDELQMLKAQSQQMQIDLEEINQRIEQLQQKKQQ